MYYGFIPAKSNSQRVPGKNLRKLGGNPLINYTVLETLKSKYLDQTFMMSDSEDMSQIASIAGVVFVKERPELTIPETTHLQLLTELITLQKMDDEDFVVTLFPTSPFRTSKQIDEAIDKIDKDLLASGLRSVRKVKEHPYKVWSKTGSYIIPSNSYFGPGMTYQTLPEMYIQNGAIYISKVSTIRKGSTHGSLVLPYEMDELTSFNIDTEFDFVVAEMLLKSGAVSGF